MKLTFASLLFLVGSQVFAWGGRGHDTICQTAVQLVQDKDLRAFLQYRPHIMGHLCNVPDVYWKSLPSEFGKEGNPTHYISSELLGLPLKELPLDLTDLTAKYNGTDNQVKPGVKIKNLPYDMGTNWWRADQFFRLAVTAAQPIKAQSLPGPANSKEQQDNSLPYNKAIYDMMVNMGLMGHFVGDNGQPFHTNNDHDGYIAGHGGLHSYYEEQVVAFFDANLSDLIASKARVMNIDPLQRTFIDENTTLEKMRTLGGVTFSEVQEVLDADPVLTPSVNKTPAVRKSAEEGQKAFDALIVKHMARSALLLAKLWDDIYLAAGKPNLGAYRSYRYPLTPDFVMPDYYTIAVPPVAPTPTPVPTPVPTPPQPPVSPSILPPFLQNLFNF